MPYHPRKVWQGLSVNEQQEISLQLNLICKEIIDDITTRDNTTSDQQSHHLRSAINSPSNLDESGKPTTTVCP